jgi:hypothetical protein
VHLSASISTGHIQGAFYSKSSEVSGTPMPIAVDSKGNAWVGNAFTTAANAYPTAVMIQDHNRIPCSSDPAAFSSTSTPLAWDTWDGPRCVTGEVSYHWLL